MPRRKKSGIDYWLENCYRCKNNLLTHYLHDGKDDCSVSYTCKITNKFVEPWHVDGCRHFDYGAPEEISVEVKKKGKEIEDSKDSENNKDK